MDTDTHKPEKLLTEFPTPTAAEWRKAAEQLLKGAPFDKVMTTATPEGITIEPILRQDVLACLPGTQTQPGFDGYLRGTTAAGYSVNPWEIAQELPYGTPAEFNAAARADLMRGQNALNLILDIATLKGLDPDHAPAGDVGACGLSLACLKDIETAFDGMLPEAISFHFRTGCAGLTVGGLFFAWLRKQGVDLSQVKGSMGMDPLAVLAAAGKLPAPLHELYAEQAVLAEYCAQNAPGIRSVSVSTLPYHQAGASSVEELGAALATGTAYLNELTERGLSIDKAAQQIRFSFAIGPNFFMEIAKIRAARVLWAQVVAGFGGNAESQKIQIHARTGLYNKTRKDPYVNMLRTTTEALSAAIAGVDSLCVGNFDEVSRLPDTFSRRISRNTQVILQEECELTAVVDPAGGSWAVEWLTNEIAQKAWAYFQEIEQQGGVQRALDNDFLLNSVESTAAAKEQLLNQRRISLVGTNVYPNLQEKPLDETFIDYAKIRKQRAQEIAQVRIELDEAADAAVMAALAQVVGSDRAGLIDSIIDAILKGATIGELTKTIRKGDGTPKSDEIIQPLRATRLAAKYEAMRDASAAFYKKTGEYPKIFLCNLGPLRRHKLRADFIQNFFQSGGFEILSPQGFETADAAVSALLASGASITVVCATDADYEEQFAHYAQAIKQADPGIRILLAGAPGEHEAAYRAAGMDDYIFVKSNNYEQNLFHLQGLGVL
jgi:methylmalonyl-CoA mutase